MLRTGGAGASAVGTLCAGAAQGFAAGAQRLQALPVVEHAVDEDELEHPVHQPDDDAQDDREHHDHPGGLDQLVTGGPGDLPELLAHAGEELPRPAHPADQPAGLLRHLHTFHGYFDSL